MTLAVDGNATVLGKATFGYVHRGHYLDASTQLVSNRARGTGDTVQQSIHAQAHTQPIILRFQMDV